MNVKTGTKLGPYSRTANNLILHSIHPLYFLLQESCAIAKMTAQCAIYMGVLKNFGTL